MGFCQPVGGERDPRGFSDKVEFHPPKKQRNNVPREFLGS